MEYGQEMKRGYLDAESRWSEGYGTAELPCGVLTTILILEHSKI